MTDKLEDFLDCLTILTEPDCYSAVEISRMLLRKSAHETILPGVFHLEHRDVTELFCSVLDLTMEASWRCEPDFPTTLHVLQSLARLTSPYDTSEMESGLPCSGERSNCRRRSFFPTMKFELSSDMVFNAKRLLEGNATSVLCRIVRSAITMTDSNAERKRSVQETVGEVCLWLFHSWTKPGSELLPLVARSDFEGRPVLCLFSSVLYHLSQFRASTSFFFALEIHRRLSNTPNEKSLVPRILSMCLRCAPSGGNPESMKNGMTTEQVRSLVDRKLIAPLEECVVRKMETSSEQWKEQIRFVIKYVERVYARLLSRRHVELFDDLITDFLHLTLLIRRLHLQVTIMNATTYTSDNDGHTIPNGRTTQNKMVLYSTVPISLRPLLCDLEALLSVYFIDNEHILTLVAFATDVLGDGSIFIRNLLLEDLQSEIHRIVQTKQDRLHGSTDAFDRHARHPSIVQKQKCQGWSIRSGRSFYVFSRFLLSAFAKYLSFCTIKPPQMSSSTQFAQKSDQHVRREKEAIAYQFIMRTVVGLIGLSDATRETDLEDGTEEENCAALATAKKDMLLWMENLFPLEERIGGILDDKEVQRWTGCIALNAIIDALDAMKGHEDKSVTMPAGELPKRVASNAGDSLTIPTALMSLSKQIIDCLTRSDRHVQQEKHIPSCPLPMNQTFGGPDAHQRNPRHPRPKTADENRFNRPSQAGNTGIATVSATQALLPTLEDFSGRLMQSRICSESSHYKELLDILSSVISDLQQRQGSTAHLLEISTLLSTRMPNNCTPSRRNALPILAHSASLPFLLPFRSTHPAVSKTILPIIPTPNIGEIPVFLGSRRTSSPKLVIPVLSKDENDLPQPPKQQDDSTIPHQSALPITKHTASHGHDTITSHPPSTKRTHRPHQRHIVRTDVVLQKYLPPLLAKVEKGCAGEEKGDGDERRKSVDVPCESETLGAVDDLKMTRLKYCNNTGKEISV